jgi:hypothetical protein
MNRSRRTRWARNVASKEQNIITYIVLIGKPGGKISLGIPRSRLEDIIEIYLREIGWKVEPDSSGSG